MADQLYLSLWFPNFRTEALPDKLVCALDQFTRISGSKRVAAATVTPLNWHESPVFQRIFVNDERSQESEDSIPRNAVMEATEDGHEDMAFEFEMKWELWAPEEDNGLGLDRAWRLEPATVKIIGFGPEFDDGAYEQEGHIRVDFGLDTPFVQEDEDIDEDAARYIQQNIEKLLAFTLSVEKHCGVSSRLLWTESGEPLAEKLIARLQRLN